MNKLTLLYVEDNHDAQERMKMILEDDVKTFYQAFDGEEGLAMYKKVKPDVILTDINMPVLDGLRMAETIKELDKEQVIIVISAFDDRDVLLKAVNIGIDFFVPKPIDIDLLNIKLSSVAKDLHKKKATQNAVKDEMNELYSLAYFDPLTNIANRFLLDTRLNQIISKSKRTNSSFCLLFIDLDNFKSINDNYTHAAGDKVLQTYVENIKSVIRPEDTFARISGDEFVIIIENIEDKKHIDIVVKKILDVSLLPIEYENKLIHTSCSIGISRFPQDSSSKNELLHLADTAMYKAKKSGKSRFSYV